MEAANDLLEKYKRHPFAKGLIPFQLSLNALGSEFSKVEAKQDGRQRWVICDKATGEPALFSHATRYSEGDNIETGNYVPAREEIPVGVDPKGVQRRANSRCLYTYVFDSYGDLSLYEGQWALDDYIANVKGFNPGTLPRRSYLSGHDEKYRSRFWMQTPMFIRKTQQSELSGAAHLHPWVLEAEKYSKVFKANPDRPRVWVKEGEDTVPIGEREPGCLQQGDIVAVSFTVTYHITASNWFPQFHPADIVVMRCGDGDGTDYSAPVIGLHNRPAPRFTVEDFNSVDSNNVDGAGTGTSSEGQVVVEGKGKEVDKAVDVGDGQEESPTVVKCGVEDTDAEDDDEDGRMRSSDTLGSRGDPAGGSEVVDGERSQVGEVYDESGDMVPGKRGARDPGGRVGRSVRRRV